MSAFSTDIKIIRVPLCSNHALHAASAKCRECDDFLCLECVDRWSRCSKCAENIEVDREIGAKNRATAFVTAYCTIFSTIVAMFLYALVWYCYAPHAGEPAGNRMPIGLALSLSILTTVAYGSTLCYIVAAYRAQIVRAKQCE